MQAVVSRERTGMVQSIMMLSAAVEQVEELLDEPLGIFAYGQERRTSSSHQGLCCDQAGRYCNSSEFYH